MKKSLLALAVLGAFAGAAQAQSSVTIYGIIDTGIVYSSKVQTTGTNTGSKFELKSGNEQGSRIGFKGVEDLGGGLKAVFNMETGFANDNGRLDSADGSLFRRRSVVGLNGGFGTVLLGRQTDFADTLSAYTGVADFGGFISNSGSGLSQLQGTRTNNSISYTTNNLNGFTGNLLYGFGETAGQTSAGQAFGVGGKYENGPLGLGLNYYQAKAGATPADSALQGAIITDPLNSGKTAAKILNVVASYQFGPARVYGNWSRVKQDLNSAGATTVTAANRLTAATLALSEKADMYELGTAYALNPTLKLLASVQHTRASFGGLDGKGRLTQINLGTDYWLSKRTDLYAVVSSLRAGNMTNPGVIGTNPTGSDSTQTAVGVGIRHKF